MTAIVQTRSGRAMTLEELQDHAHQDLAGYKLPRLVVPVEAIVRAPNGEPDYRRASRVTADVHSHDGNIG